MNGPVTETAVFMEQGSVTFTASGLGSDTSETVLFVDGVGYKYSDLPVSFTWDIGSKHRFEWKSMIGAGSGKRHVWTSASGLSSARSGMITVPSGGGSVSASYKKQYYLTIQASPSEEGLVSPSSGWHDAGSKVMISASPSLGYRFDRRVGSSRGSYTGTSRSATITVNEPITETVLFKEKPKVFMVATDGSEGGSADGSGCGTSDGGEYPTIRLSTAPTTDGSERDTSGTTEPYGTSNTTDGFQ